MNPKIQNELTWKNAFIVGGTILVIYFWQEILLFGIFVMIGWAIWKNREKIKNLLPPGRNQ